MDGLLAQYAGGPESQPNYAFPFATLYASKDPVAIDAIALRQLEEWRKKRQAPADQAPRRARHRGRAIRSWQRQSFPDRNPRRRPVKAILKSVSRSFYLIDPVSTAAAARTGQPRLPARARDRHDRGHRRDSGGATPNDSAANWRASSRANVDFDTIAESLREFAAQQSDPPERTLIENLRGCILLAGATGTGRSRRIFGPCSRQS